MCRFRAPAGRTTDGGAGHPLNVKTFARDVLRFPIESTTTMRIYLDVCCLNRPYDDQTQDRIRLEAEAVLLILRRFRTQDWKWVTSEAVEFEVDRMPDSLAPGEGPPPDSGGRLENRGGWLA
jgi:hypothetical protein